MSDTLAVVVGGGSGIGLDTARRIVGRGQAVLIVGRNPEKLASAQAELQGAAPAGVAVLTETADLASAASVHALVRRLEEEPRHLVHLVNAAGTFKPKPFLDQDGEDYDSYMAPNRGTFFVTQAFARRAKRDGTPASVVFVGSMWAKQAVKATPSSSYSMAKAGLHSLTQTLSVELAEHGVRVNAVSPAVVVTPIYGAFIDKDKIEETLTGSFDAFHPIGRVGRASDVSSVIDFLLQTDKSGWMTGAVVDVDGGVVAGRV